MESDVARIGWNSKEKISFFGGSCDMKIKYVD